MVSLPTLRWEPHNWIFRLTISSELASPDKQLRLGGDWTVRRDAVIMMSVARARECHERGWVSLHASRWFAGDLLQRLCLRCYEKTRGFTSYCEKRCQYMNAYLVFPIWNSFEDDTRCIVFDIDIKILGTRMWLIFFFISNDFQH